MEEKQAIIGILLISAISLGAYFTFGTGGSGAATTNYVTCCCNILQTEGYGQQAQQALIRTQIQTFAPNCETACQYYTGAEGRGQIFPQEGTCAANQ